MLIHVVKSGDTLYAISRRYGTTVDRLTYDNQIDDPRRLVIGQALVVNTSAGTHRVVAGDTLFRIAQNNGTTVAAIMAANPGITNANRIYPGQVITLPGGGRQRRGIDVNGFSVSTSSSILGETLPFLTYISPFSYQTDARGELSSLADGPIIEEARGQRVASLMCVTNLQTGGGFSSDIAHAILTNQQAQDTFLENVESVLAAKNYYGLIIDFEYVFPFDRESYNQFLRRVAGRLHPKGYLLATAVAPKTSSDQPGTLYEAHDYRAHGEICDLVIIMTYEWGYTYGPAMAVAPIGPVSNVLDYAVSVIPLAKIIMGMPNYGYDWTLPFVQGTAARVVSNIGAVNLASQRGASIMYDQTQQAPFFNYYDNRGQRHEVWFDDARSYQARLGLVEDYGIAGISIWTIGNLFRPGFIVLQDMYSINKVL